MRNYVRCDVADILEYMRRTLPETSREVNPKSSRNEIRKEAREYAQFLANTKETAKQIGFEDTVKKINDDILLLCKWMAKFGVKDED
jgi:hypothetical protein